MYNLSIYRRKSLFERFFDHRSSLIIQFGNGDLSKREFLEQNFDLVRKTNLKPFLRVDSYEKGMFNYQYYNVLAKYYRMLAKEIKVLQIENEINELVRKQVSEFQKDYYLKEQMRAIQKELGEDEGTDFEVDEYMRKISEARMPKEVKEKAEKEINKLLKISPSSPESGVI